MVFTMGRESYSYGRRSVITMMLEDKTTHHEGQGRTANYHGGGNITYHRGNHLMMRRQHRPWAGRKGKNH